MRVDELEHLEIQARSMFDQLFDLKTKVHKEPHKLGESDAALNRSLWGDSFSAEHHQQQQ
ncbi:hypothetical protein YC2023_001630 [Brassica napus]